MNEPKSLQEAIVYFSNPDNCIEYLAVRRWPNGVICPGCGSTKVSYNAHRRTWKCGSHHPKREFSVKVGTIIEDSPIPLDKWLTATWMLTNCKNGISSYEIARDVKVTQKSAWFMLHRIRLALQDDFFGKLERRSRSGRDFHRRQGSQHARQRTQAPNHWHRRRRTRLPSSESSSGAARYAPLSFLAAKGKVLQEEIRKHVAAGAHSTPMR